MILRQAFSKYEGIVSWAKFLEIYVNIDMHAFREILAQTLPTEFMEFAPFSSFADRAVAKRRFVVPRLQTDGQCKKPRQREAGVSPAGGGR